MLPARWPGLKCHLLTLIGVVFLAVSVDAQTSRSSVTMRAAVSETVALSVLPNAVLPNATPDNVDLHAVGSGNTVRITLSGADINAPLIRVPLIVRSNSSFKISALVESQTAVLTQLSVIDARATGTLTSPAAVSGLNIPQPFDLRRSVENASATTSSSDLSNSFLLASGPRISLGGSLDSPNNALQITLLIGLNPQPARGWLVHLTFVGTAGSVIQ